MHYQDRPCTEGTERPGDTPWDRARKAEEARQRAEAEQRQRWEAYDRKRAAAEKAQEDAQSGAREKRSRFNMGEVSKCRAGVCEASSLTYHLKGLKPEEVEEALGPPQHVQKMGSMELWYFVVQLRDASGLSARRIQLQFEYTAGGKTVRGVNVY